MSRQSIDRSRAGEGTLLEQCDTLMLDMDGTLLDLAFDNFIWLSRVPEAYAEAHGLGSEEARERLYRWFHELRGSLDWYCLDHWSDRLELDVAALHREHRSRIGYLPGARDFLKAVHEHEVRVLLVTNSHRTTLEIKAEVTGVDDYFDHIYTSHDLGHPKEDQAFWEAMREEEGFDPEHTMFVDDTLPVLHSADTYGVRHLRHVTRPDTSAPQRDRDRYPVIESVLELLG